MFVLSAQTIYSKRSRIRQPNINTFGKSINSSHNNSNNNDRRSTRSSIDISQMQTHDNNKMKQKLLKCCANHIFIERDAFWFFFSSSLVLSFMLMLMLYSYFQAIFNAHNVVIRFYDTKSAVYLIKIDIFVFILAARAKKHVQIH